MAMAIGHSITEETRKEASGSHIESPKPPLTSINLSFPKLHQYFTYYYSKPTSTQKHSAVLLTIMATVIGEVILSAVIESLIKQLYSSVLAFKGDDLKELEKWKKLLPKLQAVLQDAEDKQLTNRAVKLWLDELKDLVFDAEDVLDEFATESLKRELKDRVFSSSSKFQAVIPTTFSKVNPYNIMFYRKLSSKVKDITCRFENVIKGRSDLDLSENGSCGIVNSGSSRSFRRLESTSLVNEVEIFGREKEKEEIVKLVLSNEGCHGDRLCVIPIVGMGGLGKTTIAQLVYNDVEVSNSFELKAWCCVSEEFDFVRIAKTILQAVSLQSCDCDDLNSLQVKLRGKLASKKFLLVLDDVWNENYEGWTMLCMPFQVVAPGSKIIVTTRSQTVAKIVGTAPTFILNKLSSEASFSLLAKHALGEKDFSNHPKLKEVAQGIVQKCAGLPLAVKTLGGLLRSKPYFEDWESVLNSKLWDFSEEQSGILPALRLSYYHLPSRLKNCFAFCSIFPKDSEFCRDELVLLWKAEGFLAAGENKQMEDLYCFFDELLSRSFFQHSGSNASKFCMHDLISDLAKSVTGDLCINLNDNTEDVNIFPPSEKIRHLSFSRRTYEVWRSFNDFDDMKNLRTLIALPISSSTGVACCFLSGHLLCGALLKLRVLRVLSLSGYWITELPSSIGNLKLLRYLNLSHSRIGSLPESVCSLLNLETLLLQGCCELVELPQKIDNLIRLCHLDITGTEKLVKLPSNIANLTGLQYLSKFIVGKENVTDIGELKKLKNLGGKLCILELHNITDARQTFDTVLREKRKLFELELDWGQESHDFRNAECEVAVLSSLKPYSTLKRLKISNYGGTEFPSWIGDPSFTNMVHLKLSHCRKCRSLPPLGRLPQLKSLCIESMNEVQEVGREFYGASIRSAKIFPSLQTLTFIDMIEWECWISSDGGGANDEESFPALCELTLQNCPRLVGKLPSCLPSLRRLAILACPLLKKFHTILPSLNELKLEKCKEVTLRSSADFTFPFTSYQEEEKFMLTLRALKVLKISNCCKLTFLCRKETGLANFFDLEIVMIEDCQIVASLDANESAMNCNVQELDLLSDVDRHSYGQLGQVALKYLSIESCMTLVSIPWPKLFSSLKRLVLKGCQVLQSLPDDLMECPQRFSEGSESSSLKSLVLKDCQASESVTAGSYRGYTCSLEELEIEDCPLLECFPRGRLPVTLKRLKIQYCMALHSLPEGIMHNNGTTSISLLEQLEIVGCPSLKSFPVGKFASPLKILKIWDCCELEPISDVILCDNTSLEIICFAGYEKLVSLPESLHTLVNLTVLSITNCASLYSFPEGCPSLPNLRTLSISDCSKLVSLPSQMQSLSSLQGLTISSCPSLVFLPKGRCLPPNLISLEIWDCENLKGSLSDWNLNCLTSLGEFSIAGQGFINAPTFPEKSCLLPASLKFISIRRLPCLKSLSIQLKNLTTLEVLEIFDCPNLRSLPRKGLPPNLGKLSITKCPLLAKRYFKKKGRHWPMIASIPCIEIDGIVM